MIGKRHVTGVSIALRQILKNYRISTMNMQTEDIINLYREHAKVPFISSGHLCNSETAGHVKVHSYWTQRDIERKTNIKFTRSHIVQLDVAFSTPPIEVNNEQWNVESPSGQYRVVVRKLPDKKGEDKQYIDIWSDARKVQTINVADLDQHGSIYENDGVFGSLQWNRGETHLLYIAEKKREKSKSFFERKPASKQDVEQEEKDTKGQEHIYRDNWGEQMTEKQQSVVCVLDIESGVTSVLDNLSDNLCASQAIWSPDDMGVVCVGINHEPYRLGIIYSPNRKSALYYINLKTSQCTILVPDNFAVRYPRFSPDGSKLVYIQTDIGGPHMQCNVLKMIDWPTKGVVTVVNRVHKVTDSGFHGLYTPYTGVPGRCWSNDNRRVVLETFYRSKQELVVINTETGDVRRLTQDETVGCWNLLDVRNDLIVAACSSPNQPDYLVIGHLPDEGAEQTIQWKRLDPESSTPSVGLTWRLLPIEVLPERKNPKYADLDYECILVEPSRSGNTVASTGKPPLVVVPHGGPHSLISASFSLSVAVFAEAGFSSLLINYRGSLGFGQDNIDSLPGHVGTQDVQDCQAAVDYVIAEGIADPDKLVVTGGSHGGFLTAHLIGQYPSCYKAAVMRNPVINIASMLTTTDIPDWCYVEAGINFDVGKTSAPEVYEQMWNKSPIRYVDNVRTPTMIHLGAEDARVPPTQGREYYRALTARGVNTKCLSYAGNCHPIAKVDAEADSFVNMATWFLTHLDLLQG